MTMPYYVPPEQLIRDRADFARTGIARGRPIVVVEFDQGVLLVGANPSGSLHKISEIYDRIAFAGTGRFNEFEALRVAGVRYADLKGYSYGRDDVTAKGLANAYAQTLGQIFTHEVKPYEIEVLVAEIGDDAAATRIFRVQFDGTLIDVNRHGAIGGRQDELDEVLSVGYVVGMSLVAALRLACEAIEGTAETEKEATDWEAAVLDRNGGRRAFRRMTDAEISAARGS